MNIRTEGEQNMDDMPAAAQRLERRALEAGWEVLVLPGDRAVSETPSVALRLRRDGERLVALWVNGRFDGAWQGWKPEQCSPTCATRRDHCGHGGVSPRRLGSRELTAVVTG